MVRGYYFFRIKFLKKKKKMGLLLLVFLSHFFCETLCQYTQIYSKTFTFISNTSLGGLSTFSPVPSIPPGSLVFVATDCQFNGAGVTTDSGSWIFRFTGVSMRIVKSAGITPGPTTFFSFFCNTPAQNCSFIISAFAVGGLGVEGNNGLQQVAGGPGLVTSSPIPVTLPRASLRVVAAMTTSLGVLRASPSYVPMSTMQIAVGGVLLMENTCIPAGSQKIPEVFAGAPNMMIDLAWMEWLISDCNLVINAETVLQQSVSFSSGVSVAAARLSVIGNMTMDQAAGLAVRASLNVTEKLEVQNLTVYQGASIQVGGALVVPNVGATLVVVVTTDTVGSFTIPIATFNSSSTASRFVPVASTSVSGLCVVSTVPPTLNVGSSTLSVTISTTQCNSGLAPGAIAGIAIACVAGAIVLVLLMVFLIRFRISKLTVQMNQDLKEKELQFVK